ncbi:hypothetical protein GCM10025331_42910 [Actinoplanes utahensis]|nr:hypothetical protein Aut01nite_02820 [Actinoplanes utahensis]
MPAMLRYSAMGPSRDWLTALPKKLISLASGVKSFPLGPPLSVSFRDSFEGGVAVRGIAVDAETERKWEADRRFADGCDGCGPPRRGDDRL